MFVKIITNVQWWFGGKPFFLACGVVGTNTKIYSWVPTSQRKQFSFSWVTIVGLVKGTLYVDVTIILILIGSDQIFRPYDSATNLDLNRIPTEN